MFYSLENHSLSEKLSWLLSDKEHLLSCLEPWAFLCQETLAEATLICLKAVEKNQPTLLTEIDPCLVIFSCHFIIIINISLNQLNQIDTQKNDKSLFHCSFSQTGIVVNVVQRNCIDVLLHIQ